MTNSVAADPREGLVVRRCTMTHLREQHTAWPGQRVWCFGLAEDPAYYQIGSKDGKPVAQIPRDAIQYLNLDGKEVYLIDRVLTSTSFLVKSVRSGDTREVQLQQFSQVLKDVGDGDPIEIVQRYAYLYFPAVGQYVPTPDNVMRGVKD